MKLLFIGDISGKAGRRAVQELVPKLRQELDPALVIANGENAAGGLGITRDTALSLFDFGIDVITLGNHTFTKRDIGPYLDFEPRIIRPANYPPNNPGRGYGIFGEGKVAVINLIGRIFMDPADDPLRVVDSILAEIEDQTKVILVDMHAEATSEKGAIAWYLDGRVSAVVGTHTHVQTADERILPQGTGFITDVGMTGPYDSVLGLKPELVTAKFSTMMPQKFEIAGGRSVFCAVSLDIDPETGRCRRIERIQKIGPGGNGNGDGESWVA